MIRRTRSSSQNLTTGLTSRFRCFGAQTGSDRRVAAARVTFAGALALVFAANVFSADSASAQLTATKCYGDSVLVELELSGVLLNVPLAPSATIHTPRSVARQGRAAAKRWWNECHDEPVLTSNVYVEPQHRPFPAMGLAEPLTVQRFKIDVTSISSFYGNKQRIERALAAGNGIAMPGDLLRLEPQYPNMRGLFLANNGYTVPNGDPFAVHCSPLHFDHEECRVVYGVRPGVGIQYWFYSHVIPIERWIDLDRQMRKAVEDMIVQEERKHE